MATHPPHIQQALTRVAPGPVLVRAAGVLDDRLARGRPPRAILLELGPPAPPDALGIRDPRALAGVRVIAIGPEAETAGSDLPAERVVHLPGAVLLPGLCNAHTHLDLTGIGPRDHDPGEGFGRWIGLVMRERPTEPDAIRAAVARGVELGLRAGVVAVGDIAGAANGLPTTAAAEALLDSPIAGVSFVEVLGIGRSEGKRRRALDAPALHDLLSRSASGPVRVGLQPHAPYSTGLSIYDRAREIADAISPPAPLATHLAETMDERLFVARFDGPQRALLEGLGLYHAGDAPPAGIGRGEHPVGHLAHVLHGRRWLLAHMNDAPDHAIRTLRVAARTPAPGAGLTPALSTAVWCPRAWAYFGHADSLGAHRWLDMLDAGVPVALATDSVINLPADRVATHGMGPLDEARAACAVSERVPSVPDLLAMITTAPAEALGLRAEAFRFTPGERLAGLVAVRPGEGWAPPDRGGESDASPWMSGVLDGDARVNLLALDRGAAGPDRPV